MLSATWVLEDRTRPMETRWGKGVQEFPEKKKSNNAVRLNRGGGRWSWRKPSFPHSAQKCASCSRKKASEAWRTRPERRETLKGGEGEEPIQQARSEQARAEQSVGEPPHARPYPRRGPAGAEKREKPQNIDIS